MKERIRKLALEMGFAKCGFAKSEYLADQSKPLKEWLQNDFHGKMNYMENHFDKRIDPSKLVEESKTVIVLLLNYFPSELQRTDSFHIAKYAYGQDYHTVFKTKMQQLFDRINEEITPITGRVFTDSAPLLERALAVKAGLGWIGKNSLLLTREFGSFVFIGELVIDLPLDPDKPFKSNYCGDCRRCIEGCPTSAIAKPSVIDSRKCLSYLTIEYRGNFNSEEPFNIDDQIYGCDICQDVCPWNRKAIANTTPEFKPHPELLNYSKEEWQNLSEEKYREIFKKSPVKRTKYSGLTRNIKEASKEL